MIRTRLRNHWYDTNYYCSNCETFFDKKFILVTDKGRQYCGFCKNKQVQVRLKPLRNTNGYYKNKKYID